MPQKAAGNLKLPPISVPSPRGTHLAATSPASPPLEPPVDLSYLSGFLASPKTRFAVCKLKADYGQFPLTIGIPPAFLYYLTITESSFAKSLHK